MAFNAVGLAAAIPSFIYLLLLDTRPVWANTLEFGHLTGEPLTVFFLALERCLAIQFMSKANLSNTVFLCNLIGSTACFLSIVLLTYMGNWFSLSRDAIFAISTFKNMYLFSLKTTVGVLNVFACIFLIWKVKRFQMKSVSNTIVLVSCTTEFFLEFIPNLSSSVVVMAGYSWIFPYAGPYATTAQCMNVMICAIIYKRTLRSKQSICRTKIQIVEWDHLDLWKFYSLALASSWSVRCALYPMLVVKARLQLQQQNNVYRGMTHAFSDIFRKEGFFALYRGFWISVPQLSSTFVYSSVYERLRKELAERANIATPSLVSPLAGSVASFSKPLIYVPTDIISQYMMIHKKAASFTGSSSGAIIDCLKNDQLENRLTLGIRVIRAIYKVDGLVGFYRGFWSSCFVYVPSGVFFWASYYWALSGLQISYNFFLSRRHLEEKSSSNNSQNLLVMQGFAGALAGMFAAIGTNPIEVLRIRIQVHRTLYLETIKRLIKYEGVRVFTKGLAPRIIGNALYSSMIMIGYETAKRMSVLPEFKDAVVW
ncbi:mitochondrial carrier protein domain-containing protein [Ditylenchus destructor]|uniref:Mitochondrial carrier protein domain-containing protein n=1 Tax=Ditylenchus destructor TaxID=166010 RepID=A0AAD4MWB7_9BILA|nr:mitochondrial carrier protein domain-containing protein [Ditylenchus destructor]